ncbi:MAG: NAD(P)/FAD-dependent oxidoreductase [Spirochaetaceae bacterium]
MNQAHVYVTGGGFAGVQAARAVARRAPDARVSLIDRNSYATMVPSLPDVVSGRVRVDAVAQPLELAVAGGVEVVTDEVDRLDLVSRRIHGRRNSYDYDYLVIASGSTPAYFGFEATDGTLHSVHSLETARRFRRAVESHLRGNPARPVVIVGAGYTGLEVAASLRAGTSDAGARPAITVVDVADTILGFLAEKERSRLRSYFDAIGVEIRTSTALESYYGGTAVLSDGTHIADCLVCWAAGMRAQPHRIDGEVERTRDGRLKTTAALQLPQHPEVFAAGDAAALWKGDTTARRAVNFSYYSGRRAGANVAAALAGRALRDFRPVDLGWIIPLGDESVGRVFGVFRVGGAMGLRMHYFMCGFRHFAGARAGEFYRAALRLSRRPDPLDLGRTSESEHG